MTTCDLPDAPAFASPMRRQAAGMSACTRLYLHGNLQHPVPKACLTGTRHPSVQRRLQCFVH